MKKYFEIAKATFKAQIIYRFPIVFQLLFSVTKIIFATVVWGAVYAQRTEVAGFTLNAMLSYYIISAFLSQLDLSETVSSEITGRIRDGTFSKYMVIPARVFGYFAAQTAGKSAFFLSFNLLAAVLWVVLFHIQLVITSRAVLILGALLLCLLGLVFMVQLNFLLGILTLKFQDIWLFLMIKNNLVAFVTGTMVPLALLPQQIVAMMRFLPFYYVTYLPSMLLVGRNGDELLFGLMMLFAWVAAFIPINIITYRRLRVRYDGVGI